MDQEQFAQYEKAQQARREKITSDLVERKAFYERAAEAKARFAAGERFAPPARLSQLLPQSANSVEEAVKPARQEYHAGPHSFTARGMRFAPGSRFAPKKETLVNGGNQ